MTHALAQFEPAGIVHRAADERQQALQGASIHLGPRVARRRRQHQPADGARELGIDPFGAERGLVDGHAGGLGTKDRGRLDAGFGDSLLERGSRRDREMRVGRASQQFRSVADDLVAVLGPRCVLNRTPQMEREATSAAESRRMSIGVDEHDDVTVVTVNGEIDLDTSDEFGRALVGGATTGRVDVDLNGVSYIDSAGLGSLLTARTELEEQGMQMRVVSASTIVTRLFEIAGVADLLNG